MSGKTNPVEESNQLLQQLNDLLVTADSNSNSSNKTEDFDPVNLYFQNISEYVHESEESKQQATQFSELQKESWKRNEKLDKYSQNINNEDFNDPEKFIARVGEEYLRNVMLLVLFVIRFLQLVVASALLILAVEWDSLHDFIVRHVDGIFISFVALILISFGLAFVKFSSTFMQHLVVVLILINTLLILITFFWFMVAEEFDSLVLSPYYMVLCAVTQTTTFLFLSVLIYFKKATYKGCGIYGYATIVPLMFLILSQPYYFWWYDNGTNPELIMSYPKYMINICSGIGLAALMTIEAVAWLRSSVKGEKFMASAGILSGSFTALTEVDNAEAVNMKL